MALQVSQVTSQAHLLAQQATTQAHSLLITLTTRDLAATLHSTWTHVSPSLTHLTRSLRPALANFDTTTAASYAQTASSAVVQYARNHPLAVTVQVLSAATMLLPGPVAAAALGTVGLSSVGPVGGSLAASFQSSFGTPLLFSMGQSAAMGGWGAPIVAGFAQGGAAVAGGVAGWVAMLKGR